MMLFQHSTRLLLSSERPPLPFLLAPSRCLALLMVLGRTGSGWWRYMAHIEPYSTVLASATRSVVLSISSVINADRRTQTLLCSLLSLSRGRGSPCSYHDFSLLVSIKGMDIATHASSTEMCTCTFPQSRKGVNRSMHVVNHAGKRPNPTMRC